MSLKYMAPDKRARIELALELEAQGRFAEAGVVRGVRKAEKEEGSFPKRFKTVSLETVRPFSRGVWYDREKKVYYNSIATTNEYTGELIHRVPISRRFRHTELNWIVKYKDEIGTPEQLAEILHIDRKSVLYNVRKGKAELLNVYIKRGK